MILHNSSFIAKNSLPPCKTISSPFHASRPPRRRRDLNLSSTLTMAHISGGHLDPSTSREAHPSTSIPRDSSQASQAPTVPSSEGRVPSSPPQHRYLPWRLPTSPPPEPSVHHIPPKRFRTSGPGETFRHA